MDTLLTAWVIFLFALFAVSVVALTRVQCRVMDRDGFRALRQRPLLDLYWRELSPMERAFLWPGFLAFGLTIVGGILHSLLARV